MVIDDQHVLSGAVSGHVGSPARYSSTARTRGCAASSKPTPSFAKIELMCFSTARWVMNSDAAIARVVASLRHLAQHLELAGAEPAEVGVALRLRALPAPRPPWGP